MGGVEQSKSVILGVSFSLVGRLFLAFPITRVAPHLPFSRQQAHAGELSRQEGVQDKHHRLWTRVEVEYLEEDGKQERLVKKKQKPQKTVLWSHFLSDVGLLSEVQVEALWHNV